MKTTLQSVFVALATVCVLALGACSGKSTEPSLLIAQSERLGGELAKIAEDSPLYLDSISTGYADGVLTVEIAFADPDVAVADYSQALVEYIVSLWIKNHPGADLDTTLNTLSAEDGSLRIVLKGASGETKDFSIGHARLKKLYTLKPSELNFSAVKDNVYQIMDSRCKAYQEQYKATGCSFDFSGGFAQYTLTFTSATTYSNLTQDSLRGRYQLILRKNFDRYGASVDMVYALLNSLGVEGYRFVYEAEGGRTLKAALPWRIIQ